MYKFIFKLEKIIVSDCFVSFCEVGIGSCRSSLVLNELGIKNLQKKKIHTGSCLKFYQVLGIIAVEFDNLEGSNGKGVVDRRWRAV